MLGEQFFEDILRRPGQSILVVREILSSFTTAMIIENERGKNTKGEF